MERINYSTTGYSIKPIEFDSTNGSIIMDDITPIKGQIIDLICNQTVMIDTEVIISSPGEKHAIINPIISI